MSAVLTPPLPAFAGRRFRFTREQYYRLGELGFFDGKRVERIRGEIVEMSLKNWPHVVASRKTAEVLERVFTGVGWVSRQDPISLASSDPEPDVAVLAGRMEDYADHPTTALLVVEVADTTLFDDTTAMAEVHAEAGIADYWVLDLNGRTLIVFRDPATLPAGLGATAYRQRQVLGPADRVSPIAAPTASILVSDLLP
ncbi:MAG TPA: Uma2 family endonuclease [Gemmataceae bacterium]|nr:Uma2 family endonuclease [Gemmataceae bacterium]